jgi:hypothetical protein
MKIYAVNFSFHGPHKWVTNYGYFSSKKLAEKALEKALINRTQVEDLMYRENCGEEIDDTESESLREYFWIDEYVMDKFFLQRVDENTIYTEEAELGDG